MNVPGTVGDHWRYTVWNNALVQIGRVWGDRSKAWPVVNDAQRDIQTALARFSPEIQLVALVTLAEAALSSTPLPERAE